jgi:hypothetical protein
MTDYIKLIEALRWCDADFIHECDNCLYVKYKHDKDDCMDRMLRDAADAVEQLPKRGEWIRIDKHTVQCSLCRRYLDLRGVNAGRGDANYCPNCGAKMETQDENISKFADGEWWKEAQDDKV